MDIDLTCGFKTNKLYSMSRVLCGVVNKSKLSKIIKSDDVICEGLSEKMASNIIRVAANRIFSDPNRSFIEPVSNSIDSYNSLKGVKSIGKFGMGFFSLMYWLDTPGSKLEVSSSDGNCFWKVLITKKDDEYKFMIIFSRPSDKEGGYTNVSLKGINIDYEKVASLIGNTFKFIENITINLKTVYKHWPSKVNEQYSNGSKDIIDIKIYKNNYSVTDHASGIPFENIFNKLLVPSISTKTLSGFISSDVKKYKKSRVEKGRGFLLTIGDVSIYSDDVSMYAGESSDLMVLSLPAEFPMPVSRDDIIAETQESKHVLYMALMDLFESVVETRASVDDMLERLNKYSSYAIDPNIDLVITKFVENLRARPDIIFAPHNHKRLYPLISDPKGVKVVGSNTPDLYKLTKYLCGRYKHLDDIFSFVKVIFLPIKQIDKELIRITPDLLIVDSEFANKKNWVSNVISASNVILTPAISSKIKKSDITNFRNAVDLLKDKYIAMMFTYGEIKVEGGKSLVDDVADNCLNFINVVDSIINAFELDVDYRLSSRGKITLNSKRANIIGFVIDIACGFYMISGEYKEILNIIYYYLTSTLSMDFGEKTDIKMYLHHFRGVSYLDHFGVKLDLLLPYVLLPVKPFPLYKERLLKLHQMVSTASLSSGSYLSYSDPMTYTYFNVPTARNNMREVYEVIKDTEPIYDYFISGILLKRFSDFDVKDLPGEMTTMKYIISRIKFIYSELSTKKGTQTLEKAFVEFNKHGFADGIAVISTEFYNSVKIYDEIEKFHIQIPNRGPDFRYLPNICFRGSQLIEGIFRGSINTNDYNSFKDLSKLEGNIPLQTLEITINEGTSKPYVESILTELVQNSIDASLSLENPTIDILVTEDGITVSDQVGIPFNGLISLMTPFLSSKGDSGLTTGEMGSGFMNVFRRPGTDHVRIITRDPNSGYGYLLYGYPIVSGSRVVDIKFEISIVNNYPIKGTEIFVAFRPDPKLTDQIPSYITSGLLYANTYLGVIEPKVTVNNMLLSVDLILLESNQVADIYLNKDYRTTRPSIILTNGVPHSTYNYPSPSDIPNRGSTGLVINIKKDSYTPVQTRKRINIIGEGNIDSLNFYAAILKTMYYVVHLPSDDLDILDFTFRGLTYRGDPSQVKPTINKALYNKGEFYVKTGPYLMNYASERFNHKNMSYVINKIADNENDFSLENISRIAGGSDLYNRTIHRWFSTKTLDPNRVKTSTGYHITHLEGTEMPVGALPKELLEFVGSLITRIWNYLGDKIKGYNLNKPAPSIRLFNKIQGAAGYYRHEDHSISISMEKHNVGKLNKAIIKIMDLMEKGKHQEAAAYFKSNYDMNQFMGTAPIPRTLVHEFGHAIRGSNHSDTNAHGNFVYTVGSDNFDYTFYKGCNELWRLGLQDAF